MLQVRWHPCWDLPTLSLAWNLQLSSDLACQITGIQSLVHINLLTSKWQSTPLPKNYLFFFCLPEKAKVPTYCSTYSYSSWKHMASEIRNLISRYLHRLKQFWFQTSEGLFHQTSRQKLSVQFISLLFSSFGKWAGNYSLKSARALRCWKILRSLI